MNCPHCGQEYRNDPYELLEEMLDILTTMDRRPDLVTRIRACLRNNPNVMFCQMPRDDEKLFPVPIHKKMEYRRFHFDEMSAPVWTTARGERELVQLLERASIGHPGLTDYEREWLRRAMDSWGDDPLPHLRALVRRK